MKSNVILFLIGILLSTSAAIADITLTKANHIAFSGPVTDRTVAAAQVKLGQ